MTLRHEVITSCAKRQQGAEKSQPPEVGIEPGLWDLKANTLPRRCKAGFYRNAVEVYYILIPTTYSPTLILKEYATKYFPN